jgi:ubiquitin C-terminal hydrolase
MSAADRPCGIINFNNTCYFNSIFQCLFHTPGLVDYLLSDRFEQEITARIEQYLKKNKKKSDESAEDAEKAKKAAEAGSFSRQLSNFLKHYLECYNVCSEDKTKSLVGLISQKQTIVSVENPSAEDLKRSSMFEIGAYQDTAELLQHLLATMHNELASIARNIPDSWLVMRSDHSSASAMAKMFDSSLSSIEHKEAVERYKQTLISPASPTPAMIFQRYNNWFSIMRDDNVIKNGGPLTSIVKELFDIVCITTTSCSDRECGYVNEMVESTSVLTLQLPEDPESNLLQLSACLDKYFALTPLEETTKCSGCQKLGCSSSKVTLYHGPDYLILQLKRSYVSRAVYKKEDKGFIQDVDERIVDFPLVGLDINQWVVKERAGRPVANYDLYATSVYLPGHHVAYCRGGDKKWHLLNDDKPVIEITDTDDIQKAKPYILFYRRRDAKV